MKGGKIHKGRGTSQAEEQCRARKTASSGLKGKLDVAREKEGRNEGEQFMEDYVGLSKESGFCSW